MGDKYDDLLDDFDIDLDPKPKKQPAPAPPKPAAAALKKKETFDDFDFTPANDKTNTKDAAVGGPKPKETKPPEPAVKKPVVAPKVNDDLWDEFEAGPSDPVVKPQDKLAVPNDKSADNAQKPPIAPNKAPEGQKQHKPEISESNQNIEKAKSVSGVSDGTMGVPKYSSTGTDALPYNPPQKPVAVNNQPNEPPKPQKSPSPAHEESSVGKKSGTGGQGGSDPNKSLLAHPPSGKKKSPKNPSRSTLGSPTAPLVLPGIANHAAFEAYHTGLNAYDKERFSMLVEKNRKLKEELSVISKATEEIVFREKERKTQNQRWEQDADYVELKDLVEDQQHQIHQMKLKIDRKKKDLDEAYQYPMIREKEDQRKYLQAQLEQLELHRLAAAKVRSEQTKPVGSVADNRTEQNRKARLLEDLAELKRDHKLLTEKKVEVDKQTSKNHMKLVDAKIGIREMEKRIEAYKHNKKSDDPELKRVNKGTVEELKTQLEMLENSRRERLISFEKEVRRIEKMKGELRKQMQKMEKNLREREKDFRMNQVKMKELRRLQRHKATKPAHPAPWERDDPADVDVVLREQDKEIEARLAELNIHLESSKNSTGGYREAVEKEVAKTQLEIKLLEEEKSIKEQLERIQRERKELAVERDQMGQLEDLSDEMEEPVKEERPRSPQDPSPPVVTPPIAPKPAEKPEPAPAPAKKSHKAEIALDPMDDPFEAPTAPPAKKKDKFEVVNETSSDVPKLGDAQAPKAGTAGKEPSEIKPNPFTQNKPTFSFKPSLPGAAPGGPKPSAPVAAQNPPPQPAQPVAPPTQPAAPQNPPPKAQPNLVPKPGLPGGMPKPAVVAGPKPPTQQNIPPAKTQLATPFQDADDEEFVI